MIYPQKGDRGLEEDDEPCHLSLSPEPELESETESAYDADVDSDSDSESKTGDFSHVPAIAEGTDFDLDSDTTKFSKRKLITDFLTGIENLERQLSPAPNCLNCSQHYCIPRDFETIPPVGIKRFRDPICEANLLDSERPIKRLRRESSELAFYDPVLPMLDTREQGAIWSVHFDPQLFRRSPEPSYVGPRSPEHFTGPEGIIGSDLELASDDPVSTMRKAALEPNSNHLAAEAGLEEIVRFLGYTS